VDADARGKEYGTLTVHVLVAPVPVAATVVLTSKLVGEVMVPSLVPTMPEQNTALTPAVWTVIVRVMTTVPVVVAAVASGAPQGEREPLENPWFVRISSGQQLGRHVG
jgi:hypothetical protein